MILDKEEHRQFLLSVVASAVVQGPLADVEKVVDMAREVRDAIACAEIANEEE